MPQPTKYVSVFREENMQEADFAKRASRTSYNSQASSKIKQPTFNYKPFALRSLSLILLAAISFGLFGVLEYAILQLPHGTHRLTSRSVENVQNSRILYIRQASSTATATSPSSGSSTATSTITSPTPSPTVSTTPTATTSTSSASSSSSDGNDTPEAVTSATASTAYVHATTITTSTSSSSSSSADLSTTPELHTYLAATTAYLHQETVTTTTASSTPTTPVVEAAASTAYVNSETVAASAATTAYVHSSTITTDTYTVGAAASTAYVHSSSPSASSGTNKGHKSGNDGNSSLPLTQNGKNGTLYYVLGTGDTFISTYLPILVAVVYRMMWTMVFNSFSLIDPFRQLMEPHGALAERAFFSFYQSQSNLFGPIPAFLKRRWALGLVATAYFIACLLPALASDSVFVSTNYDCPNPKKLDLNNPCNPKIFANVLVIRVMQGLLAFAGLVILCIVSLLLFRKTGLPDDPRSMATIASLMRNPALRDDFREMPVTATSNEMRRMLEGKRYQMGFYKFADGDEAYGIRPAASLHGDVFKTPSFNHKYTPIDGSLPFADQGKDSLSRFRIIDAILMILCLGTLGVVIAYYLDDGTDGFNNFFNSGSFGPRFIVTLAGTAIATLWKSVEQSCIMIAPYSRLAKQPAAPSSTILFTPSTTPISSTVKTLRHGYLAVTAITLVTLMADLGLNIVISGVPYARGETFLEFKVSAYMSMSILGVMIIVGVLLILSRFREPRIPRQPHTLGTVMSYMCGSRMIDDFEGMEWMTPFEKDERVRAMRKKYEFRERMRRDGKIAWTVDEAMNRHIYY